MHYDMKIFKTPWSGNLKHAHEVELLHNVKDDVGDGPADLEEDDELLDTAVVGLRASSSTNDRKENSETW